MSNVIKIKDSNIIRSIEDVTEDTDSFITYEVELTSGIIQIFHIDEDLDVLDFMGHIVGTNTDIDKELNKYLIAASRGDL